MWPHQVSKDAVSPKFNESDSVRPYIRIKYALRYLKDFVFHFFQAFYYSCPSFDEANNEQFSSWVNHQHFDKLFMAKYGYLWSIVHGRKQCLT